ncbi:hypothetical protein [Microbulbifer marinus]|uniref:Uncharacterized protein n=1 Tax=Microbulbifer marinus TaxID=658218 RepID=A0A1H3XHF3_9GAMM|nr:hypothetical protein [Microbulbifer marinus]SDZ98660.1 hypothetical protein SAMN05216562_1544 [Microbulbifer marinus]
MILRKLQIVLFVAFALGMSGLSAETETSNGKKVDTKVKELSGISIIGNKEAPKSLYIVPWKSSEVGVESDLVSSLMDDKLKPLDKEVFMRELEFYELSLSGE